MLTWAWRAATSEDETRTKVLAVLAERGFGPAKSKGSVHVSLYPDGDGGTLVLGWSAGGFATAKALSIAMAADATFSEVELNDRAVVATSRTIKRDGASGPVEDRCKEASDLCEEWFEGKKYRNEAADDLVAIFVGVEDGCPKGGVNLAFDRVGGNARVQSLVDAVLAGATWEKTEIGGRKAIKLKDVSGMIRTSVLDDSDLAAFEKEISSVRSR